jgi:GAF domain-containing protein
MKSHVAVGADILSSIDFPYPVVPIVEAHHENWDGSGYPGGLSGEAIPIGARILSVVDCFDALTSDRPYRPAMREEDALEILRERRGTFYDPEVVDTFARVYRDIAPDATPRPQLQNALSRIRRVRESSAAVPVAADVARAVMPAADSSEELLAFVSLGRLASGTPTIGDVGALAWGHLRFLFPGASLALFTKDAARNTIVASYAAGPLADAIAGTSIGIGQRVSGWVAANGRTMINADARLDVDRKSADAGYALSVPMIHEGVVAGVLTLYAPTTFAPDQGRRLEIIAPHLATAIASAVKARPRTGLHLVPQRA